MAEDARISTALPRHPKTVKLLRRLQEPGTWALVCLFLWVAENRSDGNLQGLSAEDIEIAAGWKGESGVFVNTLMEVGFLDGTGDACVVHDWPEHNPWAANRGRRVEAAKMAASIRWERGTQKGIKGTRAGQHAMGVRTASDSHARGNADSMLPTQPTPTQPNPPQPNSLKPNGALAPAEWIPVEPWAGFVEMRRKTREPLTDRAITLIVKELGKLQAQGYDAGAVLDQSTKNNWKDVYPLKGTQGNVYSTGTSNRAKQRQADNLAAAAAAKRDFGLVS